MLAESLPDSEFECLDTVCYQLEDMLCDIKHLVFCDLLSVLVFSCGVFFLLVVVDWLVISRLVRDIIEFLCLLHLLTVSKHL